MEDSKAVLSLLQGVEAVTHQLGELQVDRRSAELWEVLSQHWCPQLPSTGQCTDHSSLPRCWPAPQSMGNSWQK